jgi:hypothetical protein
MNGIPLSALLAPVLICLSVAMMVGAARHKSASGNVRGRLIGLGAALLVIGLLSVAAATRPELNETWIAPAVIGSAFLGAAIGYWTGHTSRRVTH